MPTTKKRINITVSHAMGKAISQLAKKDHVPEARKASELIREALELQEDFELGKLAEKRLKSAKKFIPHHNVKWNV